MLSPIASAQNTVSSDVGIVIEAREVIKYGVCHACVYGASSSFGYDVRQILYCRTIFIGLPMSCCVVAYCDFSMEVHNAYSRIFVLTTEGLEYMSLASQSMKTSTLVFIYTVFGI